MLGATAPSSPAPYALIVAALPWRFLACLRVSTESQSCYGLGLKMQRQAVATHLAQTRGRVAGRFPRSRERAQEWPTAACRGAGVLPHPAGGAASSQAGLSCDARFLLRLLEGIGEAGVVFCDLPQISPEPIRQFSLTQMVAVAELGAGLTGQCTQTALTAAKARGTRLGKVGSKDNSTGCAQRPWLCGPFRLWCLPSQHRRKRGFLAAAPMPPPSHTRTGTGRWW